MDDNDDDKPWVIDFSFVRVHHAGKEWRAYTAPHGRSQGKEIADPKIIEGIKALADLGAITGQNKGGYTAYQLLWETWRHLGGWEWAGEDEDGDIQSKKG